MTASTADYYGILGLTSDATLADVKKAYRRLARQHHPDRSRKGPLRLPAVDRPHHRDKGSFHSDRSGHTYSRVVRRASISPMADTAA
jgi:curved DNA-binding protein CbpA